MSTGMQQDLNAMGIANVNLNFEPETRFFTKTYLRYFPFAMAPQYMDFNSQPDWGQRGQIVLDRSADNCTKVRVETTLAPLLGNGVTTLSAALSGAPTPLAQTVANAHFTNDVGHAMFDKIEAFLGSVSFDTLYPEHLHALNQISRLSEERAPILTGEDPSGASLPTMCQQEQVLYTDVPVYFTEAWGNAWPLLLSHVTDMKFQFTLKKLTDCVQANDPSQAINLGTADGAILSIILLVELVILTDDERALVLNRGVTHLVNQHQSGGTFTIDAGKTKFSVNFVLNNPCQNIMMLFRQQTNLNANEYFNFTGQETGQFANHAFSSAQLNLNNNTRVPALNPLYFMYIQNEQHCRRVPDKNVYIYNFCLARSPTDPSGTLNFSRIDHPQLTFTFSTALPAAMDFMLFAENWNQIDIDGGVNISIARKPLNYKETHRTDHQTFLVRFEKILIYCLVDNRRCSQDSNRVSDTCSGPNLATDLVRLVILLSYVT